LANARTAEAAGAKGLLLAPVSYQPLTDDEVFALFRTVAEETSLPIAVYDNPGTTHFTFSTELYARLAELGRGLDQDSGRCAVTDRLGRAHRCDPRRRRPRGDDR